MGWAFYNNVAGRPCGYGVEATCDHEGCYNPIDRGLAFLCGPTERIATEDAAGCGRYFCAKHLRSAFTLKNGELCSLCEACKDDPRTAGYLRRGDKAALASWLAELDRISGGALADSIEDPSEVEAWIEDFEDGKTPEEAYREYADCYLREDPER